jgi:hypothetical protein
MRATPSRTSPIPPRTHALHGATLDAARIRSGAGRIAVNVTGGTDQCAAHILAYRVEIQARDVLALR